MDSCEFHGCCDPWDCCWHSFRRNNCHNLDPWHCGNRKAECIKIVKYEGNLKCKMKIVLEVRNFNVNELRVKVKNGETITVTGKKKAEDVQKFCCCPQNEFIRVYKVPRNFDAKRAEVLLYSDKMLVITVPGTSPDNAEQNMTIIENPDKYEERNKTQKHIPNKTQEEILSNGDDDESNKPDEVEANEPEISKPELDDVNEPEVDGQ